MLQTTCECGRTMRANSEADFVEQVADHIRHSHPERFDSMSSSDFLQMADTSSPRDHKIGE